MKGGRKGEDSSTDEPYDYKDKNDKEDGHQSPFQFSMTIFVKAMLAKVYHLAETHNRMW